MGLPAARISDMHVCPMVTPGMPPVPHIGGPISGPGAATVLIGGMPAALMGDMCVCTGPPDIISKGSMGVMIMGKPAARMGDITAHGGSIVAGLPTVLIGDMMPGGGAIPPTIINNMVSVGSNSHSNSNASASAKEYKRIADQVFTLSRAANEGKPFCEECQNK